MSTNAIILKQRQQFAEVISAIKSGAIQQCDGFMVTEPIVPIIKHYFTYAGFDEEGINWFFVTMASIGEVVLIDEDVMLELAIEHNFTLKGHIPFVGSEIKREEAFKRGEGAIGKPYSWVGANCENLMHYIQTGTSKSHQVRGAAAVTMLGGAALMTSKNKTAKVVGGITAGVALGALLIDLFSNFDQKK